MSTDAQSAANQPATSQSPEPAKASSKTTTAEPTSGGATSPTADADQTWEWHVTQIRKKLRMMRPSLERNMMLELLVLIEWNGTDIGDLQDNKMDA